MCGADFTVKHTLSYKVGRLVSIRHNDVRGEASALAVMVIQKSAVLYKPSIYSGTGMRASLVSDSNDNGGDHGDVLVHGLWKRGEQAVLDMQVVNCDAPSRRAYMDSEKILEGYASVKKLKYLRPCINRRRFFTPLIYILRGQDGGWQGGRRKRSKSTSPTPWRKSVNGTAASFVRGKMTLSVVRNNSLLLRGTWMEKAARYSGQNGAALSGLGRVRD